MEYLDAKTIYTIFHIFGAVIGAGGAFMSDAMFFSSIKDKKIGKEELRLLRVGSRMVWIGVAILIISGALLFNTDTAKYLASSKFLVKMTVVLIIALNGLVFHYLHLPLMKRHCDKHLPECNEFVSKSGWLMASGVVSIVSWVATIILGVMRGIPYTFVEGMSIYLVIVFAGVITSLFVRKKILFNE